MNRYKSVDEYIENASSWQDELRQLRKILNSTKLEETVKWGAPCYMYDGKNVVGIGGFKSYVGLWFFQGALLQDDERVLVNAQEGKTKALRQWRFDSVKDIKPRLIKTYVREAILLADSGQTIKPARSKSLTVPPQLQEALSRNIRAQKCFESFTVGKQREFADYIADARRDETKAKRIVKILPMILEKVGLHDKYRC